MADITVTELASTVGTDAERLLLQMKEAGLPQTGASDVVTDDQKQALLGHLKKSHGEATDEAPKKISLKRKTTQTLKVAGKKAVNVEVRKKRTYVKRDADELQAEADARTRLDEATEAGEMVAESTEAVADAPVGTAPAAKAAVKTSTKASNSPEAKAKRAAQAKALDAQRKVSDAKTAADKDAADKTKQQRSKKSSPKFSAATRNESRGGSAKPSVRAVVKKTEQEELALAQKRAEAEVAAAKAAKAGAPEAKATKAVKPAAGANHRRKPDAKPATGKAHTPRKTMFIDGNESQGNGQKRRKKLKGKAARTHRAQKDNEHAFTKPTAPVIHEVELPEMITVGDLAQKMAVKAGDVVKILMGMGVMATINQALDQDTATLVVEEMGHKVAKLISDNAMEEDVLESVVYDASAEQRAPVVTVMGHVDHGKTSLLDHIRKSRVASGEAGGITQHIGAYHVETDKGMISFLDTPGHAAFTSMRARGAQCTDVVILVVAADDGVMPQTEEAIQHAKSAGVPIVVAINKMDKESADVDRVTNELAQRDVIPESWGGEVPFIPVSAHTGIGIDELLEAVLLQSEVLELKAVVKGPGQGVVVESRLDKGRGPVATLLVQNGTLQQGDIVLAGTCYGRARALLDENGKPTQSAGPSIPVEILGINGTPDAGEAFIVLESEKKAREVSEHREATLKAQHQQRQQAAKMDALFNNMTEGKVSNLNIILKADVRGSLEALIASLNKLATDEVKVNIVSQGVGGITETDAMLAHASGATIFGFNVRADVAAKRIVETNEIGMRYYSIIYDLINDATDGLNGLLAPELREEIVGIAEVREVFKSPKFGLIAGSIVVEGTIHRNKKIRVLREDVVVYEGELESLRRFKDDVNEVRMGTECGIGVKGYQDVRPGDKIEVFVVNEIARTIDS